MKPINTTTWNEFKISDLFDSQTGDTDLKKPHLNGKGHAVITSGLNNMGVFGYSDEPAKIIKKNTITVDMFGYAIFRPFDYKMVTHARVFSLEPKGFELTEMTGLYMSTIFKHLSTLFNYNNMCSYNKIKHLTVKLPIQPTLDPDKTYHPNGYIPDWDYMEAFMEQINQQAQARLNEYKEGKLEYTTLDTIGYTPVDTESWAEFKVGDLFDINSSKKIYHAVNVTIIPTQAEGYYPYVVRQKSNNGIRGYIQEDLESLNPSNTITFAQDTAELFWQNQQYFTGNKVKVMTVKNKELTEYLSLFLISVLKRAFSNFKYVTSYTVDNIKSVTLKLPVQQTLDPDKTYHPEGYIPDWNYMEAFMKKINQQAQAKLNQLEKGSI